MSDADVIARIVQEMREMALKPQLTEEDGFTSDQILKWADALASSGAPPHDQKAERVFQAVVYAYEGKDIPDDLRDHGMVRRALKFRAASGAPQRTAEGWRPIATAPVDSDVLAFCPKRTQPCVVARQRDDGLWHDKAWRSYSPTHWQPLPPPPSSAPGITPPQEEKWNETVTLLEQLRDEMEVAKSLNLLPDVATWDRWLAALNSLLESAPPQEEK